MALLFDGYDEYHPGTNKEIDKVLESGIGNCFVVLTSRPGYVGDGIRNKIDYTVAIEGLSDENIKKFIKLNLDSKEKSAHMLKQAKAAGMYKSTNSFLPRLFSSSSMLSQGLLRVPIMLLMTCVIYEMKQSLQETRTEILKPLYKLLWNRLEVKLYGSASAKTIEHDTMLFKLGRLAWDTLQKNELILRKVRN